MHRMDVLFEILIVSSLAFTVWGGDNDCYNASRTIENGKIECYSTDYRDGYLFKCKVVCIPGFQPSDDVVSCVPRAGPSREAGRPYSGSWTTDPNELTCSLPNTCPTIQSEDLPKNGHVDCSNDQQETTCTRKCRFPMVPTEPEFVNELCSSDTKFFWSHVLRHNNSEMPPCAFKSRCDKAYLQPEHGRYICHEESWTQTAFCELECDKYHMPASRYNINCGPITEFRWSSEWARPKIPEPEIVPGCKRTPITAEVTVKVGTGLCGRDSMKANLADKMEMAFNSRLLRRKDHIKANIMNWQSECLPNDEDSETLTYYFNFKDDCVVGTCKDTCNVLMQGNSRANRTMREECHNTCDSSYMRNWNSLNQMRNITLHYIADVLDEAKREIKSYRNYGWEFSSLNFVIDDIKFEGDLKDLYFYDTDLCLGR